MEAHGDARWREGFILGLTCGVVFSSYVFIIYKIRGSMSYQIKEKIQAFIQNKA
jgi:hypothetical protein